MVRDIIGETNMNVFVLVWKLLDRERHKPQSLYKYCSSSSWLKIVAMVAMQFPNFFTCRSALIFHILKHILLLIIWCNGNSSGRVSKVKILRSIDGQVDRIRFPGQLCRTTSAQDIGCDVMQKRKGQSCSCTCNVKDPAGASLVKNTVVYNNGSWQCLGSSQVRQLAGK